MTSHRREKAALAVRRRRVRRLGWMTAVGSRLVVAKPADNAGRTVAAVAVVTGPVSHIAAVWPWFLVDGSVNDGKVRIHVSTSPTLANIHFFSSRAPIIYFKAYGMGLTITTDSAYGCTGRTYGDRRWDKYPTNASKCAAMTYSCNSLSISIGTASLPWMGMGTGWEDWLLACMRFSTMKLRSRDGYC